MRKWKSFMSSLTNGMHITYHSVGICVVTLPMLFLFRIRKRSDFLSIVRRQRHTLSLYECRRVYLCRSKHWLFKSLTNNDQKKKYKPCDKIKIYFLLLLQLFYPLPSLFMPATKTRSKPESCLICHCVCGGCGT